MPTSLKAFYTALPVALLAAVLAGIFALLEQASSAALSPGMQLGNSEVVMLDDAQGYKRKIIDPIGRTMILQQPPKRIVSGILAGDEMLSRLVPNSRIRSVTYLADDAGISNVPAHYPASILRNHGAIEETIAAEPDLVIVASYSNATSVEMLLSTGVPIIRFANFHSYADVRHNLNTLARALGAESQAEAWLDKMDARITSVQAAVAQRPKPRVLYYSLSGSSAGPGSLMNESINLAGGHNVIADTGLQAYTKISPELAISLQADVVLISDWGPEGGKSAKQILLEDPAWQDVPAIKQQRVYSLRGAWLTSGSPYRVKGVEVIAELLHPEAFKTSRHDHHEPSNLSLNHYLGSRP